MPPLKNTIKAGRTSRRRGFALLITITLLAFLVLLLVSLASLTRVETQVAANSQDLAQARQNAIFALNVALGQLQRYAGPDQRTTARADSGTAQNGARMWTGVWGNANAAGAPSSSPRLLNWLVSGNEAATFTASMSGASFGQVSAASGITFTPASSVQNINSGSLTALSNLEIQGGPAVLLAGTNTVGAADSSQFVAAPLVSMTVAASVIPGLSGSTPTTVGRYAYWVGDEGIKARINQLDEFAPRVATSDGKSPQLPAYTPSTEEARNRYLVSQRLGIERMSRAAPNEAAVPLGEAAYDVLNGTSVSSAHFRRDLRKVITPGDLPLLANYTANFGADFHRYRHHDQTPWSRSVIADTLRGGLRKDLTSFLVSGEPAVPAGYKSADLLFLTSYITPVAPSSTTGAPTFGLLKSFHDFRTQATGLVPTITVRAHVPGTIHGAHPILTRASIAVSASFFDAGGGQWHPRIHIWPLFTLWNPYNARLAPTDYIVEITPAFRAFIWLKKNGSGAITAAGQHDFTAPQVTLKFTVSARGFEPGEAILFSAADYAGYADNRPLAPRYNALNNYFIDLPALTSVPDPDSTILVSSNNVGNQPSNGGMRITPVLRLASTGDRLSIIQPVGGFNAGGGVGTVYDYAFQDTSASRPASIEYPISGSRRLPFLAVGVLQVRGKIETSRVQRIFANHNIRAPETTGAPTDGGNNYGVSAIFIEHAASSLGWPYDTGLPYPSGDPDFVTRPAGVWMPSTASWTLPAPGVAPLTPMFDVPRADFAFASLGMFQHAMLSEKRWHPSYILGNSLADARIASENTGGAVLNGDNTDGNYTDWSYVLNRSMWDRFFLSTVPATLTAANITDATYHLPNGRLSFYPGRAEVALNDLRYTGGAADPFRRAAAALMSEGSFNINSTSVDAWKALLSSFNGVVPENADNAAATSGFVHPYGRFFARPSGNLPAGAMTRMSEACWRGSRFLTHAEIDTLAQAIVTELRARMAQQGGPFLSLADFINRRLEAGSTAASLKGLLQAAIDSTAINAQLVQDGTIATSPTTTVGGSTVPVPGVIDAHVAGPTATAIPAFLMQADLLQALGPALAARSDTFVIRAYGDAVNPMFSSGDDGYVTGRAWCEAVVQRLPDYVAPASDSAEVEPAALTSADNRAMGRRFKIIQFRWLTPQDI